MTPLEHFSLFVAAPAVFVLALIEAIVLARSRGVDWRSFAVSTSDLVARIAVGLLVPLSIATPLLRWAIRHRVGNIALGNAAAEHHHTALLLPAGVVFRVSRAERRKGGDAGVDSWICGVAACGLPCGLPTPGGA